MSVRIRLSVTPLDWASVSWAEHEDRPDVLRQGVIPAVHIGRGLGHCHHRQGGAGAGAPDQLGILPGGRHQGDGIGDHALLDVYSADRVLDGQKLLLGHHLLDAVQRVDAALPGQDHVPLILGLGIAHGEPDSEPVHLGIRQELGAGGAGGVLGGDQGEGAGQRMGHAVHGDLSLLHGLQQGRLGPGGGPVQLVRQEEVAEDGALLVDHPAGLLLIDGVAGDVRGQHVGVELDPSVIQTQGPGEGQGHIGLADAGDVLQQDVSVRQDGHQDPDQDLVLALHRLPQLVDNSLNQIHDCTLRYRMKNAPLYRRKKAGIVSRSLSLYTKNYPSASPRVRIPRFRRQISSNWLSGRGFCPAPASTVKPGRS